jgi:uncharacterized membrane protein YcaP (DUF421 family)
VDVGLLAAVAVRTAIVLLLLVIALRLTGKGQAGEMQTHDLVTVLVAANAVQNAMTQGDGRLSVALVSAGTMIFVGWLFATVMGRKPLWRRALVGVPTVIVEDGRVRRRDLRREGITRDELRAAIRDRGLIDPADVRLAVLEVDGTISVIPREAAGKA